MKQSVLPQSYRLCSSSRYKLYLSSIFGLLFLFACKKEPTENPSSQSKFDLGVAQVLAPDNPLIAVYSDKAGKETLSILGTKDPVFGSPLSFTQIILTRQESGAMRSISIELYADGKPQAFTDANGLRLEFTNYSAEAVDVSMFDKDGAKLAGPVAAEPDLMQLAQIVNNFNVSDDCDPVEQPFFQWLEWTVNLAQWAICALEVYVAALTNGTTTALPNLNPMITCGAALLSTISSLTDIELIDMLDNVMTGVGCGPSSSSPPYFTYENILDCISAAAEIIGFQMALECSYIKGQWRFHERVEVKCTLTLNGQSETLTEETEGTRDVEITQNGCDEVKWYADGDVIRLGSVAGNYIEMQGFSIDPFANPDLNLSTNQFNATGEICGSSIEFTGEGRAEGTLETYEGTAHFLCKTKSTAWCWYPN